jgi:hypothetical protein
MTQDEIIEMAKQAGFDIDLPAYENGTALAIKLAKLVAAKAFQDGYEKGVAAFNEAVLIEREACALICERVYKRMCPEAQENEVGIEAEIIRARGQATHQPQRTEPVFCEYCGGNDENPPDHCMDCARPQRTWVGLTDEEIDECDWGQSERDHARAIEAKLKQKNGYAEEKNT